MKTKDWFILGGALGLAALTTNIFAGRFSSYKISATSSAVIDRGVEMSELSGNPAGTSIFSEGFQNLVNSIPQSEWDRALSVEPFWTPPTGNISDRYLVAPYSPPGTLLPQNLKIGSQFGVYYITAENETLHLRASEGGDLHENLRFREDGALIKSGRVDWREGILRSNAKDAGLDYYFYEGIKIAI